MRKFRYLILLLSFLIVSCSTSFEKIESSSIPELVPTLEPTFTPLPTTTMVPESELLYIIKIDEFNKSSIHVELEVINYFEDEIVLTFWTNAANWFEWMNPKDNISNLAVKSIKGEELITDWVDDGITWTGDHGLKISNESNSHFLIEYDVKLGIYDQNFNGSGTQYIGGYLSNQYGFAEPEFIFLAPNNIESKKYHMRVLFDLPSNWKTATHWTSYGENEYLIDPAPKKGGYSAIEFANGAIAFGDFFKSEEIIGNTRFSVAVLGFSESDAEKMINLANNNFKYYTENIGLTPTENYILVIIPAKVDGNYVNPYNENIGGFFTRIYASNIWNTSDLWWVNISHPVFHNWTPGYLDGEFWFIEGFTSYYELKSLGIIAMNDEYEINRELINRYNKYKNEILGSENDYSLVEAGHLFQSNHGDPFNFITYKKASLFAYLLDLEISERTKGEMSLDDVMRYLFEEQKYLDSKQLVKGILNVTGEDFSQIVNDYLEGNLPLPFSIQDGTLVSTIES